MAPSAFHGCITLELCEMIALCLINIRIAENWVSKESAAREGGHLQELVIYLIYSFLQSIILLYMLVMNHVLCVK